MHEDHTWPNPKGILQYQKIVKSLNSIELKNAIFFDKALDSIEFL